MDKLAEVKSKHPKLRIYATDGDFHQYVLDTMEEGAASNGFFGMVFAYEKCERVTIYGFHKVMYLCNLVHWSMYDTFTLGCLFHSCACTQLVRPRVGFMAQLCGSSCLLSDDVHRNSQQRIHLLDIQMS